MNIVTKKKNTPYFMYEGFWASDAPLLKPDFTFSVNARFNNGKIALETKVVMGAGDAPFAISVFNHERIEYSLEQGEQINFLSMAQEVERSIHQCFTDGHAICTGNGQRFPLAKEFPVLDIEEISQGIAEDLGEKVA